MTLRPVDELAAWYIFASLVTFLLYGWDKFCAKRGLWRVREWTLHVWEFLGGWPGAVVGQRVFRHKTAKTSFRIGFYLAVILNMSLLALAAYVSKTGG